VQHRRIGCIRVAHRFAIAEPRADGPWIRIRRRVQRANPSREARLWHVTKRTGLVSVHREILVEVDELSEQRDLFGTIEVLRLELR
jgi:hypothetical protein